MRLCLCPSALCQRAYKFRALSHASVLAAQCVHPQCSERGISAPTESARVARRGHSHNSCKPSIAFRHPRDGADTHSE